MIGDEWQGKGSVQRKTDTEKYEENYDRIFRKCPECDGSGLVENWVSDKSCDVMDCPVCKLKYDNGR